MGMFNWATRREGRGREPIKKERASVKARLERLTGGAPAARSEAEELPEIAPEDMELIVDEPPVDKVLRYLDATEKFIAKNNEVAALTDQYERLKADKGENHPETKGVEVMVAEANSEYEAAKAEAEAAAAEATDEEKELVHVATTPEERNQLRMERAAAAAAASAAAAAERAPVARESELPEIAPEDMELIQEGESSEVKDKRWFGGLRDSASRFVKRHTTGAVDQRENLSTSEKVSGGTVQLAEGLIGGVASVAGVKLAYDLTLGVSQEIFTRAERESLITDIQRKLQGIETLEGKREGNAELATRFSAIESRIDSSEHLTGAQKRELKEKLGAIIDEDDRSRRAAVSERDDQVRALFEGAIKARLTGAGVAKEALNSAMAATGLTAMRGGVMLGLSAVEAYRAASKELQGEQEKAGFANTAKKAFADSWSTYKDEVTGKKGIMGIGRAASKTVRVLGFGGMLGTGLVDVAQGNAQERIDHFLNNWGNTSDNMMASMDRATLGTVGGIGELMSGEGDMSEGGVEDMTAPPGGAGDPEGVPGDVIRGSGDKIPEALNPDAGAGMENPKVEAPAQIDIPGVERDALSVGLVREGDGISQAVARQIDTMPKAQFDALAAKYGFTGDRAFDASDAAHDHVRSGDYKKLVAKITRDIMKDHQAHATEHGLPQEGFAGKAIGEVSAVLVADKVSPSGFHVEYFNRDGSPLVNIDETQYGMEGAWDKAAQQEARGGGGAAAAAEAAPGALEVTSELSNTGRVVQETVYKIGDKAVTFDGSKMLLNGAEVDLDNLGGMPEADALRRVLELRSEVLNVTDQLYQAALKGEKARAAQLLTQLRGLDDEGGTLGITVDIPDDALDAIQSEYQLTLEAPEPKASGVIKEVTLEREANGKPVEITFEHTGEKVTGADLSKFRIIGKDLILAKEAAKEGLGIDLDAPAARTRTLMPDVKRYYVLSRIEESLDAGGKGRSKEATWVRGQIEKLYTKYHPEEVVAGNPQ